MKRRGFTLIELLVVIAIIAILAAILFPVFANAKERARQVKCLNNLKQLTQAFKQYCDDYNGVMPSSCGSKSSMSADGTTFREWTGQQQSATPNLVFEKGQIWKYTHNKAMYQCPTDAGMRADGIHVTPACTNYPLSYSLNCEMGSIYGAGLAKGTESEAFLNNLKLDTESAGRAGKVLFLIHEAHVNYDLERQNPGNKYGINDGYFSWKTTFNDMPSAVHYNGTTCSYVDGHVKWISYTQLLKDADYADAGDARPNYKSQWLANTRKTQYGYW